MILFSTFYFEWNQECSPSTVLKFDTTIYKQLKMRHLKKIRETDAGQIKEQDVSLTWDSPQIWYLILIWFLYFFISGADFQIKDLRRQLEKAQDDVYKIEKEKDELSVKVEEADKALEEVIWKS